MVSIHATLAGGDMRRNEGGERKLSFYPRHPRGWRPHGLEPLFRGKMFLSTPPSRVATYKNVCYCSAQYVSIHATLAGGDARITGATLAQDMFLSTPPSRVATISTAIVFLLFSQGFYPRHPRGWRQALYAPATAGSVFLSTPPSRVATPADRELWNADRVSIHATLAGGDHYSGGAAAQGAVFLSTPPSRVATGGLHVGFSALVFLSTPPSRVATR